MSSPLGPDELIEYFTVRYRSVAKVKDAADPDDEPDNTNVSGTIIFTPNLNKNSPVVRYPEATDEEGEPFAFELFPLRKDIQVVNGVLNHNGNSYVKLEASSEYASPVDWTWHVEFDLTAPAIGKLPRAGFDIAAVPGSVIDLVATSPVSSSGGQQIIQGPRGWWVEAFRIEDDDQMIGTLNDPAATDLPPVTIPAVTAAQAAATAAQGYRDAAQGHATTAQGHATSASASAASATSSASTATTAKNAAEAALAAFDLDIGTVTTSAPGGSAVVTLHPGGPPYVMDLTLPRGATGPQGDPGPAAPDATGAVKGILQFGGALAGSNSTAQVLANDSVGSAQISTNAVGSDEIATGAVGSDELAADAVTTVKIGAKQVTGAKIADDTITSGQIAADAVGSSELADNAVDTNAIANLAVTGAKIANTTITDAQISTTAAIAANKTLVPASFPFVSHGGTRTQNTGDLTTGIPIMEALNIDKVTYWFDTADASGSTTVKLRRQRAGTTTDIVGTSTTVAFGNQTNVSGTDSNRTTATLTDPTRQLQAGDRLIMEITALGGTPGKVMGAWIYAKWA